MVLAQKAVFQGLQVAGLRQLAHLPGGGRLEEAAQHRVPHREARAQRQALSNELHGRENIIPYSLAWVVNRVHAFSLFPFFSFYSL